MMAANTIDVQRMDIPGRFHCVGRAHTRAGSSNTRQIVGNPAAGT
jgi:hypothetical protein